VNLLTGCSFNELLTRLLPCNGHAYVSALGWFLHPLAIIYVDLGPRSVYIHRWIIIMLHILQRCVTCERVVIHKLIFAKCTWCNGLKKWETNGCWLSKDRSFSLCLTYRVLFESNKTSRGPTLHVELAHHCWWLLLFAEVQNSLHYGCCSSSSLLGHSEGSEGSLFWPQYCQALVK
jgi:hypothetical protein